MANELSKKAQSIFEQIRQVDEQGNEYWGARQLAKALDYTDFRNFLSIVGKAKEACKNSEHTVEDHIVDFNEMVIHSKCSNEQPRSGDNFVETDIHMINQAA